MDVKIDIISGFLGAGKTTLIKKLISEKLYSEKLVIIENEYGEVGIDGSILKSSQIEVREINSGCICCTLVGDFEKAVREVISRYNPDRIIIEPSGVGKLSDVLKASGISIGGRTLATNMVITVVDALKYQIYMSNFGEFYENQISNAGTIVLSRTQKSEAGKLDAVVRSIRKLNPEANIITTPWDKLSADIILAAALKGSSRSMEKQLKEDIGEKHVHHENCGCGHEHHRSADEFFDVWGIETPKVFSVDRLKSIVASLEDTAGYGTVLRGKGILQTTDGKWAQFDYTPGEWDIKAVGADYTGRLCIIGRNLNKRELGRLFGIEE